MKSELINAKYLSRFRDLIDVDYDEDYLVYVNNEIICAIVYDGLNSVGVHYPDEREISLREFCTLLKKKKFKYRIDEFNKRIKIYW